MNLFYYPFILQNNGNYFNVDRPLMTHGFMNSSHRLLRKKFTTSNRYCPTLSGNIQIVRGKVRFPLAVFELLHVKQTKLKTGY